MDLPTLREKEKMYLDKGFYRDQKFDYYPILSKDENEAVNQLIELLAENKLTAYLFSSRQYADFLYLCIHMSNVIEAIREIQKANPGLWSEVLHEKALAIGKFESYKDQNIKEGAETHQIHASNVSDSKPGENWIILYIKFTGRRA